MKDAQIEKEGKKIQAKLFKIKKINKKGKEKDFVKERKRKNFKTFPFILQVKAVMINESKKTANGGSGVSSSSNHPSSSISGGNTAKSGLMFILSGKYCLLHFKPKQNKTEKVE